MLNLLLWVPKHILYSHAVIYWNLRYSSREMDVITRKCERLHRALFGSKT